MIEVVSGRLVKGFFSQRGRGFANTVREEEGGGSWALPIINGGYVFGM
jgi:hypothetical protein